MKKTITALAMASVLLTSCATSQNMSYSSYQRRQLQCYNNGRMITNYDKRPPIRSKFAQAVINTAIISAMVAITFRNRY